MRATDVVYVSRWATAFASPAERSAYRHHLRGRSEWPRYVAPARRLHGRPHVHEVAGIAECCVEDVPGPYAHAEGAERHWTRCGQLYFERTMPLLPGQPERGRGSLLRGVRLELAETLGLQPCSRCYS